MGRFPRYISWQETSVEQQREWGRFAVAKYVGTFAMENWVADNLQGPWSTRELSADEIPAKLGNLSDGQVGVEFMFRDKADLASFIGWMYRL